MVELVFNRRVQKTVTLNKFQLLEIELSAIQIHHEVNRTSITNCDTCRHLHGGSKMGAIYAP
jgi:hypothetical protein